ncbi:cytidylyltransferase domain-containing protein [Luedemannella helvata]|uniref:Acylneuraminate cytidylyltransferase family protein n=1 Tax=Luedemannella helvata TaxID=349315 RepID=A0ABN2JV35_9ACTN
MKAVIPAKSSSTRVIDKNFRPFHGDRSLLDLLIDKLLRVLPPEDIYVSSEDPARRAAVEARGVRFLDRPAHLAENATPYASVVSDVCRDVPGDDDIMWCHATDPLFDAYADCLERWAEVRDKHDSLVVVYPRTKYMLDTDYRPMGFGFGPWHVPSQHLPTRYELGFTLSVLRRPTVLRLGPIGAEPHWFHATNLTVDIDTEDDFRLAQAVYAHLAAEERQP